MPPFPSGEFQGTIGPVILVLQAQVFTGAIRLLGRIMAGQAA